MEKLIRFFRTDKSYIEEVSRYSKVDAALAVAVFALQMILYYLMGRLQAKTNTYLGVPVSLFFIALCIFLALIRKDGLKSLGFNKKHAVKSALTGLVLGAATVLIMLAAGLASKKTFASAETIIVQFFYYLIIIALPEEIVYRGYLPSRLFGFFRSSIVSAAAAGVMFVVMHIPYHMGAAGLDLLTYCRDNLWWLMILFLWHLVFTYLFRRFNSILAPTFFHALLDWSNILLV